MAFKELLTGFWFGSTVLCSSWLQTSLTLNCVNILISQISVIAHNIGICLLLCWSHLGISYFCGKVWKHVFICPLSSPHRRVPHAWPTVLSEVWPGLPSDPACAQDVCPFQNWAAVWRLSSSAQTQQKWNTVAVELFHNTPMIHTWFCSLSQNAALHVWLCSGPCPRQGCIRGLLIVPLGHHCAYVCVCVCVSVMNVFRGLVYFSSVTIGQLYKPQFLSSWWP